LRETQLLTFESTLPLGEPDLMRVSAFQRYLDELVREHGGDESVSKLSSLSPSLLQDLLRFDGDGKGRPLELLEVLAASVRHARSLAVHLQLDERVVTLTVFPVERLAHCQVPVPDLLARRLGELQVMHVEPSVVRPLGDRERSLIGEPHLYHPLGPLSWELALHGAREELLPEIAGNAAYRVAPGVNLRDLGLSGTLAAAVRRLQRQTTNLREMAEWPGFDRGRAMRLLNGLYLQAGLIVSRSHPAATNEGWFAGSAR
jgi:hypothetical protein